jgi:glycosyltransferase involved in cell wall biosynthesis
VHIAFLIDKLGMGGTERQLVLWANRLRERRLARVSIVCLMSVGSLSAEVSKDIEIVNLGLTRIYGFKAMRALFRLRQWCRAERVDLVQSLLTSANNFGSLLGKLAGARVVASRRDVGIYPGYLWQKIEEKWAFRAVDSVICVSEAVRTQLLRSDPGLDGKLSVIPNAVDVDAADRLAQDSPVPPIRQPYIITVGRITPVKAYDFLLDAAPRIDGKLVVIGGGPDLQRFRQAVEDRGLGDRLEFVGEKSLIDTAILIRHAAFSIHPSYSEGMSNAILEYMTYGKAVVCRDLDSNRELITQGRNGFLFRANTDFVEQVNRLTHTPELQKSMGLAARQRIIGQHELDTILGRYMEHYQKLVGRDA